MIDVGQDTDGGEVLVDGVASWLMTQALGEASVAQIFEGCCVRILGAGIPLSRGFISFRTLHPLFASVSLIWRRGEGVHTIEHLHGEAFTSDEWRRSPMYFLMDTGIDTLRRRLTGEDPLLDFPVLFDLREKGATDYFAVLTAFADERSSVSSPDGTISSWATDRARGFNDWDLGQLQRLTRRLSVACKVQIKDQVARNLLDTYLGPDAGRLVLSGQIRRGDGREVHAVIWYSDMRDSTRLAESMPGADFLALVNRYFECTAGAVMASGGQVLRFIGDAVLAIFPVDGCVPPADGAPLECVACHAALNAARDAEQRLAAFNAERAETGLESVDFGLGLHVGDVIYGNIGVPDRLEFSVIGPAANEVARIETLTKVLKRRVLASAAFAGYSPGEWESLGAHPLRGVGAPIEVFGLRQRVSEAPATTAVSALR